MDRNKFQSTASRLTAVSAVARSSERSWSKRIAGSVHEDSIKRLPSQSVSLEVIRLLEVPKDIPDTA